MSDRAHLQANLDQKKLLRADADERFRKLSQQAMHGKHDEFGNEQVNEKLGNVKNEIEALDVEIAQLEQQIAGAT